MVAITEPSTELSQLIRPLASSVEEKPEPYDASATRPETSTEVRRYLLGKQKANDASLHLV